MTATAVRWAKLTEQRAAALENERKARSNAESLLEEITKIEHDVRAWGVGPSVRTRCVLYHGKVYVATWQGKDTNDGPVVRERVEVRSHDVEEGDGVEDEA